MSGTVVVMSLVAVLLVALPSLVAPVVPATVTGPAVVGVPETEQVTVCPTGTLEPAAQTAFEGLIVQAATVTPDGKPVTPHKVPTVASAVPTLVQLKLPVYGTPTEAVAGKPSKEMAISGRVVVIALVVVLLAVLMSFVAPVVPVTVTGPAVVGVPATVQVTVCPTGTLVPGNHSLFAGLIVQAPTVTPEGRPLTPHSVPATASALPALVQLKLPVYGTPTDAVAGKPARETPMSGAVVPILKVAVLLAALPSWAAPVVPVTALEPEVRGTPETAHVTVWFGGTLSPATHATAGSPMVQAPTVTPDGKPVTPHSVSAAAVASPRLVQVKLPL